MFNRTFNGRIITTAYFTGLFIFCSTVLSAASTVRDTYLSVEAIISAPDSVPAETDFDVYVEGNTIGGTSSDIFAYYLYENAEWFYDTAHRVEIISGTLIDESKFNWGSHYDHTYTLNRSGGTHRFTFIYGYRTGIHGWYDLAVELNVVCVEQIPVHSNTVLLFLVMAVSFMMVKHIYYHITP